MVIFNFLNNLAPAGGGLGARCRRLVILGSTLDTPVEDVVVLIAFTDEEVTEELAEVRVVGLVVEAESTSVVEEDAKFVGEASAEQIGGGGHLLLHDTVVLLLLGGCLETLPGKGTAEEVHEDISEGFEVITTSLLDAKMGVDGSVAGGTGQVLVLAVGDVKMSLGVTEFLCKAEIDDVDLVATLADAHQKVVGFDVAVDEVTGVSILNAGDLKGDESERRWTELE